MCENIRVPHLGLCSARMVPTSQSAHGLYFQFSLFLLLIFLLEAISGVLAYMYDGVVCYFLTHQIRFSRVPVSTQESLFPLPVWDNTGLDNQGS